jgi:penicillin-binding protein 2
MVKLRKDEQVFFEEAFLGDERSELIEVELSNKTFFYAAIFAFVLIGVIFFRVLFLGAFANDLKNFAEINAGKKEFILPQRGIIYDRFGKPLAQNKLSYKAVLNLKDFVGANNKEEILNELKEILDINPQEIMDLINLKIQNNLADDLILKDNLNQKEIIELNTKNIKAIKIKEGFSRMYYSGEKFSSVLGYVGLPSKDDLKNKQVSSYELIGKAGIELKYDDDLRGSPGIILNTRDALGNILSSTRIKEPQKGNDLTLTIDADFEEYLFNRMSDTLKELQRTSGAAIALDPSSGEVLALLNFPAYDNNAFVNNDFAKIKEIINNPSKPLFIRAISGAYSPGSTIKPLVGIAALAEGIITPDKKIFSPGYLDIPNPYNPENPTRFLDWRYQGEVNLSSAIAQSSNVYFYVVGGGFKDLKGLGIDKLREWWQKFGLGQKTGIDLVGEANGFLPSKEGHQKTHNRPWSLGDTYNVSIGQGDLAITPIQLINYIAAIANGGKIYKPFLAKNKNNPEVLKDLSYLNNEIEEVKKGMKEAVSSPLGTAHLLSDLPFNVFGKTGTAQIQDKKAENAFFVGFIDEGSHKLALLILVENSKQGSLNAVPIAYDAFKWYYENRIKNNK